MPTLKLPKGRSSEKPGARPKRKPDPKHAAGDVRVAFAPWHEGAESADGEQRIYCPLCEDPETSASASASINADSGQWNCLKTDEHGGSIYQLGLELKKLDPDFRIGRTVAHSAAPAEERPTLPPSLEDQSLPDAWHARLLRSPDKLEFLTAHRGLRQEAIDRFNLGWDGERYTIPIRYRGEWVNVRRYSPTGRSKILNRPGHGTAVLAFTETLHGNTLPVVLAEGEFDALLTADRGEAVLVAVTGTGGADNPPRDLSLLAGRDVFVAYDCDKAGVEGAQKVAGALRSVGATVYVLDLTRLGLPYTESKGADLTDYFLKHRGTTDRLVAEMKRLREETGERERFKPVSAAELAKPVPPMKWLVKGVWPEGSYGTLAGEKKTLKTYTGLSLALAVASGEPFLGTFTVPEPRPVLMYLGEGGQKPTTHRVQRLAAAMGVDLASLPLRVVFDAGDITGEAFLASLKRAVDEQEPGLVIVDPFYAFHPPGVEAQNLYDRGAMLAQVQASMPPGCAFVLADHFRKTGGKDLDLDSIAQSGVSQWADSWILQNHDTPPQVDEGQFAIGMQFGSRQWGGRQYVVDWSLGRFNADTGEHDGALEYCIREAVWGSKASKSARVDDEVAALILHLLETEPLMHTMTSARDRVSAEAGVGKVRFKTVWDELAAAERIVSEKADGAEGRSRQRWRVSGVPLEKLHVSKEVAE